MRYDGSTLWLSRRNLETLLAKLDGHPPNSSCTIVGGTDAYCMRVGAEEDEAHYVDRPAGRMDDSTEAAMGAPRVEVA